MQASAIVVACLVNIHANIESRTNFMNHSKYNPKYDPKNSAYQPQTTAPVEQIAATTPAVITPSAQAQASNSATKSPKPNRQATSSDSQETPLAMQTLAAVADSEMDAVISDSRQSATGKSAPGVREPSALTGGLPELAVAPKHSETGEKTPELSAKSIS
jgi:hypothetical protein